MFIDGKTVEKTKRMIIKKVRTAVGARGAHRGLHGPSPYSFIWGTGTQTFALLFGGCVRVLKVFCKCDIFCNKHMGRRKKTTECHTAVKE